MALSTAVNHRNNLPFVHPNSPPFASRLSRHVTHPSSFSLPPLHRRRILCPVLRVGPSLDFFPRLPASRLLPVENFTVPLVAVLSGAARWIEIFRDVVIVRVLLSWFPNVNWDRQPFSAIRDLADPYLSLFRKIVPPLFGKLDISILPALAVLGTVISLLSNRPPVSA